MYDTVCTLPFAAPITALAIHPSKPIFVVGLVSGHVEARCLPANPEHNQQVRRGSDGTGTIDSLWRTRRHKGSCRSVCFSYDGGKIVSAGTDGIIKVADTATGKVEWKMRAPQKGAKLDRPNQVWCPNPHALALGTESGALHFYNLDNLGCSKPSHTYQPHDDDISSLSPLPQSSEQSTHFFTTGASCVATVDLRKGVLHERDMGEEMFSSCSLPADGIAVGGERGLLRFWRDARKLSTELETSTETRVRLAKNESIDSLSTPPKSENLLAAGMGDGSVKIVDLRQRKTIHHLQHDDIEPVIGLGFESEGRMISAGGQNVKIWQETIDLELEDTDQTEEAQESRRVVQDSDEEGEDSSEDERPRKRRKKKRGKGQGSSNGILGIKDLQ